MKETACLLLQMITKNEKLMSTKCIEIMKHHVLSFPQHISESGNDILMVILRFPVGHDRWYSSPGMNPIAHAWDFSPSQFENINFQKCLILSKNDLKKSNEPSQMEVL